MQRQFASFKQFLQETAHCQRTGIFFDARLAILNKGRATFEVVEAVGIYNGSSQLGKQCLASKSTLYVKGSFVQRKQAIFNICKATFTSVDLTAFQR